MIRCAVFDVLFNRFSFEMGSEAIRDCSRPGAVDEAVAHWAGLIERPADATVEAVRAECKETGAWEESELEDDAVNWERIVWIGAANVKEECASAVKEMRLL